MWGIVRMLIIKHFVVGHSTNKVYFVIQLDYMMFTNI